MGPVLSIVMAFPPGMAGRAELNLALACATAINVYQIQKYGLPSLYQSHRRGLIRGYAPEVCRAPNVPGACERFVTAKQLHQEGEGDCDDLAPYHTADRIIEAEQLAPVRRCPTCGSRRREPAAAKAIVIPSPGVGWHAVTQLADGRIEDPSQRLGMGRR